MFRLALAISLSMTFCLAIAQDIDQYRKLDDRFAVVIGISSYQQSQNNLKYAAKDAADFKKSLLQFGRFKEENIKLLVDKEATSENIRKNIEGWLKSSLKKDDLAIIFFSGHGAQVIDTDGDEDDGYDECLVPYDFSTEDNSSIIVDDVFAYWIRNLGTDKVMIIFDNCFSGGAAKEKGISMPGIKGGSVEDDFSKDINREIPRKGAVLLAACRPEQKSLESDALKNGIFTYFLINSTSTSIDNNFNNIIDSQELFYSVRQKTVDYSINTYHMEQEPILVNGGNCKYDLYYIPPMENKSDTNQAIEEIFYKIRHEKNSIKKIELLERSIKMYPDNIEIHDILAEEYGFAERYEDALSQYKYLYSLNSRDILYSPPLTARIGDIYKRMSNYDEALRWYLKADEEIPKDADNAIYIAELYLLKADTLNAIENYNRSLKIQPLQRNTYLALFYIYLSKNSLDLAINMINRCNNINPNDFETIYWRGILEKYFKKDGQLGDSLLSYFEKNSGIIRYYEFNNVPSDYREPYDYLIINYGPEWEKAQLENIEGAIMAFPYYLDFYAKYFELKRENASVADSTFKQKYKLLKALDSMIKDTNNISK